MNKILLSAILLGLNFISTTNIAQPAIKYIGSYNSSGKPDYLESIDEQVSSDFIGRISSAVPERMDVPSYHPSYLSNDYSADIRLIADADVYVTFVMEGAGYKNVLGFYSYQTISPPTNVGDIDTVTIIFPNVSRQGSGGQLIAGNKVNIGNFSSGTTIGFVVFANGWNGSIATYGKWQHYSDKYLNPPADTSYKQHSIVLYDNITQRHVICFEDITRPGGDKDFNDAVFFGTTSPASAAFTQNSPGLPVVWEGSENSQWENPNNWNPNIIPDSSSSVTISSSAPNTPYISTNIAVNELVVEPGASLNTSPEVLLSVNGDYTANSEINGDLSFVGDTDQTIYGSAVFNDIKIDNDHIVKVDSDITIEGNLILQSGDLITQGHNVTLLSSNSANGMLITENGAVSGELIFKRIIPNHTGYHYLSSPIQNATLQDINDDFTLLSLGGNTSSTPFPNIYTYDETNPSTHNTDGWTVPLNLSHPMTPGYGFATYIAANTVIDFEGTPNDGPVDVPISFTFSGELAEDHPHCPPDGWNLLGNPYPSALDWDKVETDMKEGIDIEHGLYLWNPNIHQYATYVNGITTNGGSNRIAAFQGFFIRSTGSDTIKLRNNHRTIDSTITTTFFKQKHVNILKITATFSGKHDETAIYSCADASYDYNSRHDGYKMVSNDKSTPQIFTTNEDQLMYSINGLPEHLDQEVQLCILLPKSGVCTMSSSKAVWNNEEYHPFLYDKQKNVYTDLMREDYTFESNEKEVRNRFTIVFKTPLTKTNEVDNKTPIMIIDQGRIIISMIEQLYEQIEIKDLRGRTVFSKIIPPQMSTLTINSSTLPKGIYLVSMRGQFNTLTKKIILH